MCLARARFWNNSLDLTTDENVPFASFATGDYRIIAALYDRRQSRRRGSRTRK